MMMDFERFLFLFTLVAVASVSATTTTPMPNVTELATGGELSFLPLPVPLMSAATNSISEINKTVHQLHHMLSNSNVSEAIWKNPLVNNGPEIVANFTKQVEASLNSSPVLQMLYNASRQSVKTGTAVLTDSVARPATFFLGQNLRLLGNGLGSLGHTLKISGYQISNFEPVIQNVSQALSQYGMNLVNASLSPSNITVNGMN